MALPAPGTLTTGHGEVPTPTFMAVGTAGTVKAMTADAVRATRRQYRARQYLSSDAAAGCRAGRTAGRVA